MLFPACYQWISHANTYATYTRPLRRRATLEECQQECVNYAEYTGVQFYTGFHLCDMTGPRSEHTVYRYDGRTYYELIRNCPPPDTSSSKRCSSCSHLYNVRQIKAAFAACCRNIHIDYRFYDAFPVILRF